MTDVVTLAKAPVEISNEAVPAEWRETPMDATDRCDTSRCGAQAFVRTFHRIQDGKTGDLLWCKHHFEKAEDALRPVTLHVQDERGTINTTPSPSANAK